MCFFGSMDGNSIKDVTLKSLRRNILYGRPYAIDSEIIIQKSLEKLSKGRTTIVVAHRLSALRNADKIVQCSI